MKQTKFWVISAILSSVCPFNTTNAQLSGGLGPVRLPDVDTSALLDRADLSRRVNTLKTEQALGLYDDIVAVGDLSALPSRVPLVGVNGQWVANDIQLPNGWRAIEHEWLLYADELTEMDGVTLISKSELTALGMTAFKIRVNKKLDSLATLKKLYPKASLVDRNYVFVSQSETDVENSLPGVDAMEGSVGERKPTVLFDGGNKIGMIDTDIELQHPSFATKKIQQKRFLPANLKPASAHATAVVGVLIGERGLAPNAKILNASVFYKRDDYTEGATTDSLLNALNWLVDNDVKVINMSLSGPPHPLLALAIEKIYERDVSVVAAVGNQGPAAKPMYPAAYPSVIAATAVDAQQNIYRWAVRGPHVDVAALGVSILTTRVGGAVGRESGTSIASPMVAAFVADLRYEQGLKAADVGPSLQDNVVDLGEPGRDPIFGEGALKKLAGK